jgi:putative transposase
MRRPTRQPFRGRLKRSRRIFPFIQRVFADSGYAGEKVAKATLIAVEIVRKNPDQVGWLPAQAPDRPPPERSASVLCQFHLSRREAGPSRAE